MPVDAIRTCTQLAMRQVPIRKKTSRVGGACETRNRHALDVFMDHGSARIANYQGPPAATNPAAIAVDVAVNHRERGVVAGIADPVAIAAELVRVGESWASVDTLSAIRYPSESKGASWARAGMALRGMTTSINTRIIPIQRRIGGKPFMGACYLYV